jgi:hypothetical protein
VAQYKRLQHFIVARPPHYRNDYPNYNESCPVRGPGRIRGAIMAALIFLLLFVSRQKVNKEKQSRYQLSNCGIGHFL